MTAATTLVLAWGALAFGAVYPWAYWPLFLACAGVGGAALVRARSSRRSNGQVRPLVIRLLLVLLAVVVQAVPLPTSFLRYTAADAFLRQYDIAYAAGGVSWHALSVDPGRTWIAAAGLAALVALFAGLAAAFRPSSAQRVAGLIAGLGTVVALVGIVQRPLFAGRIYGFWTPEHEGNPFGPFVNRNHFAGWMLLALPLALGYLCARLERVMRDVRPGVRNRLIWILSEDASQIQMLAAAVFAMAVAMTLTLSRSGIVCAMVASAAIALAAQRREAGARRWIISGVLAVLLVVAVSWAGLEALASRFGSEGSAPFAGRLGAWRDAWRVAVVFMPFGCGFNTYGLATLFFQRHNVELHYTHAHNDYLQLLAEGGLLVAIPSLLAGLALVRLVRRRLRDERDRSTWWIRLGAATGLMAVALQEVVDFSLRMPGNAALFVVVAALAAHPSASRCHPSALRPVRLAMRFTVRAAAGCGRIDSTCPSASPSTWTARSRTSTPPFASTRPGSSDSQQ